MPCIVHQRLLLRNQKQPNALESNGVISMLYLCLAVWLMNPGAAWLCTCCYTEFYMEMELQVRSKFRFV